MIKSTAQGLYVAASANVWFPFAWAGESSDCQRFLTEWGDSVVWKLSAQDKSAYFKRNQIKFLAEGRKLQSVCVCVHVCIVCDQS